jgi:transposase
MASRGVGRPNTDKRDAQLADLLLAGKSYEYCAKLAGIQVKSVKHMIKTKHPDVYAALKSTRGGASRLSPEQEARRNEIAEMVYNNPTMTLEQIGEKYGLTRERVRQLASQVDNERYVARRTFLRETADRERQEREERERPDPRFCRVCGVQLQSGRRRFCSARHYDIATKHLRYHVDDRYRIRHRTFVARWLLEHGDELDEKDRERQLTYAARVLDPDVVQEEHGRWLTRGSKAMDAALECYRKGYPLFDELPEQIQTQVKNLHDALSGEDV